MSRTRALLAAHPVVWFTLGVLFAGQLPGEPLHTRMALVALLLLAIVAGIFHECVRRGGTADLLDQLAASTCPAGCEDSDTCATGVHIGARRGAER